MENDNNKKRKTSKKSKKPEITKDIMQKVLDMLDKKMSESGTNEKLTFYKFHKFLSLAKTKSIPYKEWMGETINDEIVVVNYTEGVLRIGSGYSEIKARNNMYSVGTTQVNGYIRFDPNLTVNEISNQLKLEWVLPDGYFEE